MRKYRLQTFFLVFILYASASLCYAQEPLSSNELIKNAKEYDGREVIYEGEVVGQLMQRKEGVWANVYDGQNAIGIWLTPELAQHIQFTGSYKAKGDIIQVRGILHSACPEHGGDMDIHAILLHIIQPGWAKQDKLIPEKRNVLIVLLAILCILLILRIFITK